MNKKFTAVLMFALMVSLSISLSVIYAQETTTTIEQTTSTTMPETTTSSTSTTLYMDVTTTTIRSETEQMEKTTTTIQHYSEPNPIYNKDYYEDQRRDYEERYKQLPKDFPEKEFNEGRKQMPPEFNKIDPSRLPPGCFIERNEFNEFVKCEQKNIEEIREKAAERCRQFRGEVDIRPDGWIECKYESKGGFFGVQCSTEDMLKKQSENCKGQVFRYTDRNGCGALSCSTGENLERTINEKDPVKAVLISCQVRGGEVTFIDGKPECLDREEEVRIPEHLRPIEPEELLDIALRIEGIIIKLEETADKIKSIADYYKSRNQPDRARGFEAAFSRLQGAIGRLEEIKLGLSKRADNLNDQDRKQVIIDIKSIKGIMKDVAIDILSGGRSSGASTGFKDEKLNEPVTDFMNAIKHCDEFSKDKPFEFSPEPQTRAVIEGVDNDKCIFIMHFPGGEVKFLLPSKAYQFFNGPQTLFLDDVECSPDVACKMFKEKFSEYSSKERFGEKEFKEEFNNNLQLNNDEEFKKYNN